MLGGSFFKKKRHKGTWTVRASAPLRLAAKDLSSAYGILSEGGNDKQNHTGTQTG